MLIFQGFNVTKCRINPKQSAKSLITTAVAHFSTTEDAHQALLHVNGIMIDRIKPQFNYGKKNPRIILHNVNPETTKEQIKQFFSTDNVINMEFSPAVKIDKGEKFMKQVAVEFSSMESAISAQLRANNQYLNGNIITAELGNGYLTINTTPSQKNPIQKIVPQSQLDLKRLIIKNLNPLTTFISLEKVFLAFNCIECSIPQPTQTQTKSESPIRTSKSKLIFDSPPSQNKIHSSDKELFNPANGKSSLHNTPLIEQRDATVNNYNSHQFPNPERIMKIENVSFDEFTKQQQIEITELSEIAQLTKDVAIQCYLASGKKLTIAITNIFGQ
ncbi:MAG: hypothetical protein EZS28_006942 [Streblomastix strix]|uniref:RRM domain-containing protein n=1 Tax=Streblomastix strix TaxID=222440 RepID=A0A5J4WRG7_9EUKA|nr:MAG: hypothetical protein EZS28_006942 [Streblomastix strix]